MNPTHLWEVAYSEGEPWGGASPQVTLALQDAFTKGKQFVTLPNNKLADFGCASIVSIGPSSYRGKFRRVQVCDNLEWRFSVSLETGYKTYDDGVQTWLNLAKTYGHKRIGLHLGPFSYVIDFEHMFQENTSTGTKRAIARHTIIAEDYDTPDRDDVPAEFRCPISCMPFVHPVVTSDGVTYERKHIRAWLEKSATSPLTRESMDEAIVLPNLTLQKAFAAWKDNNPEAEQVGDDTTADGELSGAKRARARKA